MNPYIFQSFFFIQKVRKVLTSGIDRNKNEQPGLRLGIIFGCEFVRWMVINYSDRFPEPGDNYVTTDGCSAENIGQFSGENGSSFRLTTSEMLF